MPYTVEYRSGSTEAYRKFKSANPDIRIGIVKWRAITRDFNELFAEYLLQTGEREKLSHGMGSFSISKKKTVKIINHRNGSHISLPVDWVQSKKLGKKIYMMNSHSDGFRCKWKWFREESTIKLPQIWMFKAIRPRSRDIARYLKDIDGAVYLERWKQWETKR